jgi:wyosine [tRNA(Phe)-imidazoG37] synthetase (radical SAM superfamily)
MGFSRKVSPQQKPMHTDRIHSCDNSCTFCEAEQQPTHSNSSAAQGVSQRGVSQGVPT